MTTPTNAGAADANSPEVLEQRFVELVGASWKRWNIWEHARRVDDVALGSVIASYVESGWQLIDLESDGQTHMARFQSGDHRLAVSIVALSEDPVRAQAQGRLVQVTVAYGQRVRDLGRIMSTIKQEMKSSMIANTNEPGVITFDGDMNSGYVYAQVNLLLDLDDYFDGLVQGRPSAGTSTRRFTRYPSTSVAGSEPDHVQQVTGLREQEGDARVA